MKKRDDERGHSCTNEQIAHFSEIPVCTLTHMQVLVAMKYEI
jgi:hypothetical protein